MTDHRPPLLAWGVPDERGEGVIVLYARSEAGARSLGRRWSGLSFGEVEAVRHPQFDKYATDRHTGDLVENDEMFAEGWRVPCASLVCDHLVDGGDDLCEKCWDNREDEEGIEDADAWPVVIRDGFVYCSQRCVDEEIAYVTERRRLFQEARDALLHRHPFVIVTSSWLGATGQCEGDCRNSRMNACIHFRIPGGDLDDKTREGNHCYNSYCHGCKNCWIARGNLEAWQRQVADKPVIVN